MTLATRPFRRGRLRLFLGSVTITRGIVVRAANRLAAGFDGDVILGAAADGAIIAGCLFRADATRSTPRITLNGDNQRATRNKLESSPGRVAVIHVWRQDAPQLNCRVDRNEVAGYDLDAIRIASDSNADSGKDRLCRPQLYPRVHWSIRQRAGHLPEHEHEA